MRSKTLKSLLFGCSLLLGSCGSGPKVTLCAFSIETNPPELVCLDHDDKVFRISIPEAERQKYVSMPSSDLRTLTEYCGLKGKDKQLAYERADHVERLLAKAVKNRANQDELGE